MKNGWMLLVALTVAGTAACHHDPEPAHAAAHQEMKGPLGDFHKVLAPIWHSDKGLARDAKACDHSKQMLDLANAAVGTAHDPAAKSAAQDLSGAVSALASACNGGSKHDVDAKFVAVHTAFHKATEGGGAHHH